MDTGWRSVVVRRYGYLVVLLVAAALLSGCLRLVRHQLQAARAKEASRTAVVSGGEAVPAVVRAELERIVGMGVTGVTAIVMRDGRQMYRIDVGDIGPATRYPVASASKWLTAALVMTVVDEGKLTLDGPIGNILPEFRGPAGQITVRELLAQTAGTGSLQSRFDIRQDPRMTLAQSAAEIAARPLEDPPGQVFRYGGPGFQVAGALVEAVTGKRWAELFAERLARPLGMTQTSWEHLPNHGVTPAETLNPLLQGGAVTTADDYLRFLTMLAQGGSFAGRRILSPAAVEALETVQTLGKPLAYLPRGVRPGMQYALGNWCEQWDPAGRCTLVSSPGAFGTYPWIDRQSGLYGIFFLRDRLPRVVDALLNARAAIIANDGAPAPAGGD